MFHRRRLLADAQADRLRRAMEDGRQPTGGSRSEDLADYLELARMIRPAESQSESHRAAVRARMLHADAQADIRTDAGTRDGLQPSKMHSVEVGAPSGATIKVADIEPVDGERLARVVEQLNAIAAESAEAAAEER